MRTDPLNTGDLTARAASCLLVLAAALGVILILAAPSKAAPVSLTFDHGRITIGELFKDQVVLPAPGTFPSDQLPAPQRTDIQLNGDLDGDRITIPAATNAGTQFPYMFLLHPIEKDLRIPITMRLNEPGLTGTFNGQTGAMTLDGQLDLVVVTGTGTSFPFPDSLSDVGVPPLGLFARCRIDNLPVSFSTGNTSPITGQAFTGGFGKNGALTTSFDKLPASVSENGGACDDLNRLLNVAGGIWLSNGVVEPVPQPDPPAPTCETNYRLCPPSPYTEIDGVRLKPGRKTVKPGKRTVLTVRVHNSGTRTAVRQVVKIKSSNRRVKVPSRIVVTVPANGNATRKFKVRVKRRAKGKAVISAGTNGWWGNTYLKIKRSNPKRR